MRKERDIALFSVAKVTLPSDLRLKVYLILSLRFLYYLQILGVSSCFIILAIYFHVRSYFYHIFILLGIETYHF